jgi:hypothetical protein
VEECLREGPVEEYMREGTLVIITIYIIIELYISTINISNYTDYS